MNQNLFIIGPVASGKNTLLDNLKRKYNRGSSFPRLLHNRIFSLIEKEQGLLKK